MERWPDDDDERFEDLFNLDDPESLLDWNEDILLALLDDIPFVDHHVHAPYREDGPLSLSGFRRPFTESAIEEVWNVQLPSQLGYRWMVRELALLLGVEQTEEAVLEARNAMPPAEYHRMLAQDANISAAYADDLFALGECYDISEWSELLGCPVYRVLRIETFVEQGLEGSATLEEALERLTAEVAGAPENGIISLKSIAGYRTGLAFNPPASDTRARASHSYNASREHRLAGGWGRIADQDRVDTIVWTALEAAAPLKLPMQFHVAFGDDDIVMTRNDPTLMRALFQHEPFRVVPLVLLHCYPHHRKAGYLASIYPNVYVDLGLTIPIVGPGAARVLEETLELAPVRQVLASTDGHMTPEFQWFGVFVWRQAIVKVATAYLEMGALAGEDAEWFAESILKDNALRIYPRWT
ncbi:amidohydrolase family protein [soil metagenome]